MTVLNKTDGFSRISFVHVPHAEKHEANEMAQIASGVNILDGEYNWVIRIEKRTLPALVERGMPAQIMLAETVELADRADQVETVEEDLIYPIVKYRDPLGNHEKAIRL